LLWNRYHPIPADAALKRLPELTRCFIPKVDARGVPGTDFIECKWEEFADLFKNPRSDALTLRKRFAANFIEFGKMLAHNEAVVCNTLAGDVMLFGVTKANDAVKKRFGSRLAELEKLLKKRIVSDKYLRSVLLLNVPVPDNFKLHIEAASGEYSAAGRAEMQFLRQVMLDYLQ
jgi:hypothetical protein